MRTLNQPGSPNASVLPSMGCGGLAPYRTQGAVWVGSRRCARSIPRSGLVVRVYVSLMLILLGSLCGSVLPVKQQGWQLPWKCSGKGRLTEVASWRGVVCWHPTVPWLRWSSECLKRSYSTSDQNGSMRAIIRFCLFLEKPN